MIASLRGTIKRLKPEEIIVHVGGIGYRVFVPISVWDNLQDDTEAELCISSYIREEKFDLYGFSDEAGRILFEKFIDMSGIGPKLGLELSAVPKSMLMQAIGAQDSKLLTSIKGIGKKTAEKLLLDLKNLAEKQPEIFGSSADAPVAVHHADQDAVDALKNLGYDSSAILQVLQNLPDDITTTEDRVAAAIRSL